MAPRRARRGCVGCELRLAISLIDWRRRQASLTLTSFPSFAVKMTAMCKMCTQNYYILEVLTCSVLLNKTYVMLMHSIHHRNPISVLLADGTFRDDQVMQRASNMTNGSSCQSASDKEDQSCEWLTAGSRTSTIMNSCNQNPQCS